MPRTRQETRELYDLRKLVKQLEKDNLNLKEKVERYSDINSSRATEIARLEGKAAGFLDRATRAERRVVKLLDQIDLFIEPNKSEAKR